MSRFSDEELRRYGRQMLLREVGGRGQERLRAARLRLRASGTAGAIAADYLRRAGVPLAVEPERPEGPSLLCHEDEAAPLLFCAGDGAAFVVGPGCPCGADAEVSGGGSQGDGAAGVSQEAADDSAAAVLAGSLLALEALKRLLDLPEALRAAPGQPREVLRVALSEEGPLLERRGAPACACPAPAAAPGGIQGIGPP